MPGKSTMPMMWRDLMEAGDADNDERECCVCRALGMHVKAGDRHHMVPRSAGKLFDAGMRELPKPTVRLCGMGNASGCHGRAHSGLLHFRFEGGRLEFLLPPVPMDRLTALSMDGWRPL